MSPSPAAPRQSTTTTKTPTTNGRRPLTCQCEGPTLDIPSFLEALGNPSAVISRDYEILTANQAYRDRFNHGKRVCGKKCFEVTHRLHLPCREAGESCPVKRSAQSRRGARALHVHWTSRGEEQQFVSIHPLFDVQGEVMAFLEILSPPRLAKAGPRKGEKQGLVGRSTTFNRMLDLVARVAPTETTVVLLGESGTGKELVARALHDMGPRAHGPFVPVDCSGLTETLFESELFGHEKGAFTGADCRKQGLVEAADGGTLFLDEVGDIPLSLQVKLLRLLETGVFRRVGNIEQIHSDFRLVCATHRDLGVMVQEGTFRSDLYYRISAFPVELPPLRERSDDIPLLAKALLRRLGCLRIGKIHPDAMAALQAYEFPGNVRELHNILERACLLAEGDTILLDHLPSECSRTAADSHDRFFPMNEVLSVNEMEGRYLLWALAHFHGDRSELAHRLGMSERTLYRKLHQHQVATGH